VEGSVDPDAAQPLEPRSESEPSTSYSSSSSSSSGSGGAEQQAGLARRPKSALRRYVESFDQETMMETARWVGAGRCWDFRAKSHVRSLATFALLRCVTWHSAVSMQPVCCQGQQSCLLLRVGACQLTHYCLCLPPSAGWSRSSRPR